MPLSNPAGLRVDRADDVAETLSCRLQALALRTVGAHLDLAPLFLVEDEATGEAGRQLLRVGGQELGPDDPLGFGSLLVLPLFALPSPCFIQLLLKITIEVILVEVFCVVAALFAVVGIVSGLVGRA